MKQKTNQDRDREITYENSHRILVIDDNPQIHKDWRQLLEGIDADAPIEEKLAILDMYSDSIKDRVFEIDFAFHGQDGLKEIHQALQEKRPYVMAIVDIRMPPGWDGLMTIEHIWEICPELHIVICAAYSDYTWSDIVERLGKSEKLVMLKYPYNKVEVKQFIIGLAEKVGCKLSAKIERALRQMAESMRPRVADAEHWLKGAESGDVLCMVSLGSAYLGGYGGVRQDRSQAVRWLREAARLGNEYAKKKLVEIGEMKLTDRYNTLPEWMRWILCWPLSLIIAVLCSWLFLFVNSFLDGEFMRSLITGVIHPPLCHAIFLLCIYWTVPRAKLAVLLTFAILRSLVLLLFIVSACITLMGFGEIITFNADFLRATIGEVAVLLVSIFLWKEIRRI